LQARARTASVAAAFDEVRFGRENMLDLRSSLPTATEASRRAELFLRERQVAGATACLVITGRGNQSANGVPVVRPAVERVFLRLRRTGVVGEWSEHTPGSFVVTPAPLRALFEAPRRHGDQRRTTVVDPAALSGLQPATREVLRQLAVRSLHALSVPADESFVHDEMQRQFALLSAAVVAGPDRESRLCTAALRVLDELDDIA
jgi:hypothetical protein